MKVSAGWKVVLYAFAMILLVQVLDLPYYLMNQKDSYLANLGIIAAAAGMVCMGYCLVQVGINGIKYIKEVEQKENKNKL
jgi:hypothetical protein